MRKSLSPLNVRRLKINSQRRSVRFSSFKKNSFYLSLQFASCYLFPLNMANNSRATKSRITQLLRNQRSAAKRRLQRQAISRPIERARLSRILTKKYRKMSLIQKYEFALNGYEFPNLPGQKAIILSETAMKTDPKFKRCIRAGPLFDELPEGFIILFSHRCITNYQLGGTSSKYQVTLPRDRFLQPHQNPKTKYGLAQFINCCLPTRSRITHIDGQNMKEAQCEIKHAKLRFLTENLMKIAPACVRTMNPLVKIKNCCFPVHMEVAIGSR